MWFSSDKDRSQVDRPGTELESAITKNWKYICIFIFSKYLVRTYDLYVHAIMTGM